MCLCKAGVVERCQGVVQIQVHTALKGARGRGTKTRFLFSEGESSIQGKLLSSCSIIAVMRHVTFLKDKLASWQRLEKQGLQWLT